MGNRGKVLPIARHELGTVGDPQFRDRMDSLRARKPGDPHSMVDAQAFHAWIADVKASAQKTLDGASAKVAAPTR